MVLFLSQPWHQRIWRREASSLESSIPPLDHCSSLFPKDPQPWLWGCFIISPFSTITAPTCCLPDVFPHFHRRLTPGFLSLFQNYSISMSMQMSFLDPCLSFLRIVFSTDLALHHITLTSYPSLDLAITNNSNALLNISALHSLWLPLSYLFSSSSLT